MAIPLLDSVSLIHHVMQPHGFHISMQAARYQMIIMFIIAATTSVGAVATLYMASSYCIDACGRLRLDRISKRDKANAWNARLGRRIAKVLLSWEFRSRSLLSSVSVPHLGSDKEQCWPAGLCQRMGVATDGPA